LLDKTYYIPYLYIPYLDSFGTHSVGLIILSSYFTRFIFLPTTCCRPFPFTDNKAFPADY